MAGVPLAHSRQSTSPKQHLIHKEDLYGHTIQTPLRGRRTKNVSSNTLDRGLWATLARGAGPFLHSHFHHRQSHVLILAFPDEDQTPTDYQSK
jgi:hypothetical protein